MKHLRALSKGKPRRMDTDVAIHDRLNFQRLQLVGDSNNHFENAILHVSRHAKLPLDTRKQRSNSKPSKAHERNAIWAETTVVFGGEGKIDETPPEQERGPLRGMAPPDGKPCGPT